MLRSLRLPVIRKICACLARVGLLVLAAALTGCPSDSEYALQQNRAARAQALDAMRAATRAQPRGEPVAGEALATLLARRTHVFAYGSFPNGKAGSYEVYQYYSDGGRLVFRDNWIAARSDGTTDRWRIEGPRLCLTIAFYGPDERCYTLSVRSDGQVRYYVDKPGDPAHGLLTMETTRITGEPPP